MPATPEIAAGWRIEPPVSVPGAAGTSRAATAAAEPPERAARYAAGSQGLLHRSERRVLVRRAHRELVHVGLAEADRAGCARAAPPRSRRRARRSRPASASRGGRQPRVTKMSLCATGTPAAGRVAGGGAASASRACGQRELGATSMNAFSVGWPAMRARKLWRGLERRELSLCQPGGELRRATVGRSASARRLIR